MLGEKQVKFMVEMVKKAMELQERRIKLFKEAEKTKDVEMLINGMYDIMKEMEKLKDEVDEFSKKNGLPTLTEVEEEHNRKQAEEMFSQFFSNN